MSFRESILSFHPDFNGGDTSKIGQFTKLMAGRKAIRKCNSPVCENTLPKKCRLFCSKMCEMFTRFHSGKLAQ